MPTEAGVETHALETRDDHTACACQASSGGEIDGATTARVVGYNTWRWQLGKFIYAFRWWLDWNLQLVDTFETQRFQNGAHFTGYYVGTSP